MLRLIEQWNRERGGYANYWHYATPTRREQRNARLPSSRNHLYWRGGEHSDQLVAINTDPPDLLLSRGDSLRIGIEVTELVYPRGNRAERHREDAPPTVFGPTGNQRA